MSLKTKLRQITCSLLVLLAGCGGQANTDATGNNVQVPQLLVASVSPAVDYTTVVQQLYISYFGRPADIAGLTNFKNQLAAIGAPADLQKLEQAYSTNPAVKVLIDSFGMSTESHTLYAGDNMAFVIAVYKNVLGRTPDAEGLAFWVGALDNGSLTRGRASLSIMAGALANTSAQGLRDATLVQRKVSTGSDFTNALIDMEVSAYSGAQAAEKARQMLANITIFSDTTTFKTTINTLVSSLVIPTDNGKYTCAAISHGLAVQLFSQGHSYLDRDSDGKPCEATDKYIEIYGPVKTTTPTAPATPVTPPSTGGKQCYVSGYTKKNGTYVKGYYRSC